MGIEKLVQTCGDAEELWAPGTSPREWVPGASPGMSIFIHFAAGMWEASGSRGALATGC